MMTPTTTADEYVLAIRARDVDRRFGEEVAPYSFPPDAHSGHLITLPGPSRSAKTTALRIIAGFDRPDRGTIEIGGTKVVGGGVYVPPEMRRVGMVFQGYALFPHLTVARNVAYGVGKATRKERVDEVLRLVGLDGKENRHPHELSGGEQHRVALARALAPEPGVILLDEPFSNLDASLRARVRSEVADILRKAGTTAVFVTHDQEEALSLADRVGVMRDGRLHQVADPQTLYTAPATRFVAEFVGEADVLPGTRAGRFLVDTPVGRLPTATPLEATSVAVVVRPEALRLKASADGPATVTAISYFGHDQLGQVELDDGRTLRARRGPHRSTAARSTSVSERPRNRWPAPSSSRRRSRWL